MLAPAPEVVDRLRLLCEPDVVDAWMHPANGSLDGAWLIDIPAARGPAEAVDAAQPARAGALASLPGTSDMKRAAPGRTDF